MDLITSTNRDNARHGLLRVLLALLLYGVVYATARLGSSWNLGDGDVLENIYAQVLAGGYSTGQLPLYTWLVWGLEQLFGSGVTKFLLLKYSLLLGTAGFLFLITRRVTGETAWGYAAVGALALLYQVFWRTHETHSHLLATLLLAMATVWWLMQVVEQGRNSQRLWLAGALGLGLLTQFTFGLFVVVLGAACWWQPALRQRVCQPWLLGVVAGALLLTLPYGVWLSAETGRWAALLAAFSPNAWATTNAGYGKALWEAIQNPLASLLPLLLFLLVLFPRTVQALYRREVIAPAVDWVAFLLHCLGLAWVGLLLFNVAFQVTAFNVQDLLPFSLLAIPVLMEGARRSMKTVRQRHWFMVCVYGMVLVALGVRLANLYVHEPVCSKCRWGTPYATFAAQLRQSGFEDGEILTTDPALGGNLRIFFPNAVVRLNASRCTQPNCRVVGSGQPPADLKGVAISVDASWEHLWKPAGYRHSTWWYAVP